MTGIVAAEARKLWTIRTSWVLTAVGLGFVGLQVGFYVFEDQFTGVFTGTEAQVAAAIDQIASGSFMVLVVAVLAITNEFRHGTVGRSLQLTPSRTRLLAGKLAIAALYGLAFFVAGLVLVGVLLALAAPRAAVSLASGPAVVTALWHGPVALVLTGVLGVAVGALIRSQVVAVTVSLVWIFVVENLFTGLAPAIARWLPFQALQAVFLSDELLAGMPEGRPSPLEPAVALTVYLAYVVVFAVAAGVLLRSRDV
jgi:ABC-2 type transport system permease protein